MRPFEVSDHVVLKQDLSFYGYVQRTHSDSYDPLEDELIIAHTEVPPETLQEFVTSGIPPPGYVFVQFANPAAGSSLVHQNDLTLLSRSFRLGDYVKQQRKSSDRRGRRRARVVHPCPCVRQYSYRRTRLSICHNTRHVPRNVLRSSRLTSLTRIRTHSSTMFPAREVRRAQDVTRDNYIISGNWIGLVDEVEYDVVISLQDGAVVVLTSVYGLQIPVPDYGKLLVALPEPDGFKRPDIVGATQGWAATIPLAHPRPGDFVIVERQRLRNGRWITGTYNTKTLAQGIVLDTRARDVSVDWMSSSQEPGESPESITLPKYEIQLYDNIRTFRDTSSLRKKKDVTVYDTGKMPLKQIGAGTQTSQPAFPGQELGTGMRVRFRDTSAAAVKYQGVGGTSHGRFVRTPADASHGWDVNEFEIVYMQQHVTVLWQDGTTTTTDSTALTGFALFEPEISPTDIVLKREGMRQKPANRRGSSSGGTKDFNEMMFFERPHDLLPASVGVIQSVDPNERIARVRWYKEPKIELRASGQVVSMDSRFGPIGDLIEDVSLYEIMSFPSLLRQRCDMCVISTSGDTKAENSARQTALMADDTKPAEVSVNSSETNTSASRRRRRPRSPRPSATASSNSSGHSKKEADWIGQIVAVNLDGSITVRLGALQNCRDVKVEADSILSIIDDREHIEEMAADSMMDLDSWMGDESEWSEGSPEPIAETVEYEGGQRMDNDSGDDNWESDEDEVFEDADEEMRDGDGNGDVQMSEDTPQETPAPPLRPERSLRQLQTMLPSEPPAQFLVLDREPPADQFGLYSASGASLKRIAKEHKILSNSLPEGEIYVRTYESRLDLLRCLIVGPKDTPYENAPFLIDLHLPERFPHEPPIAHFHSWTSGLGRINPNLYEEGKICLSLLGTWSGKNESEKWTDKATILQLLVSLQGLVFVNKPFYNEAGFEGYENDRAYTRESEQYSEKAFVMARGFVKYALLRPPGGLEDILAWLFLPHDPSQPQHSLLATVIKKGKLLLEKSEEARAAQDDSLLDAAGEKGDDTKVFLKPLSRGASVMLKRSIGELQAQLDRLCSICQKMEAVA